MLNWVLEEYKIIQSKIDKLGEDKFRVRSWCVSIVSGLLIGARFSPEAPKSILGFAAATILIFQMVEHRQRNIAHQLATRARQIESALRKRFKGGDDTVETQALFLELGFKGPDSWRHVVFTSEEAINRKARRVFDRIEALIRAWYDLLPIFQEKQSLRLRRDIQRLYHLKRNEPVLSAGDLDDEWRQIDKGGGLQNLLENDIVLLSRLFELDALKQ